MKQIEMLSPELDRLSDHRQQTSLVMDHVESSIGRKRRSLHSFAMLDRDADPIGRHKIVFQDLE